ncbi:hypothetical protein WR25_18422 [Diploscapter pachys]|uniref:NADH dehydrogenase [ubiquinone] 1 alpha subcomplex subunit 9, mitochondrial n=1 Tax=Diploscapter pachys TaxID=2018661 RepID=A0A2A2JBY4_9BILA|nr:hypothetical protein WR25_18422 [Diploscapter pachys]
MLSLCAGKTALSGCRTASLSSAKALSSAASGDVTLPPRESSLGASFRKGTGGRASFNGNVVTVFGANGFLGFSLVNHLAKNGTQIIVPYRCDPHWVRQLKVVGELGQILFSPFQLKDERSIRTAVQHSNVVVNLIGSTIQTKNYSFHETHVESTKRLARIAKEMGVKHFIHVSALGASLNPPKGHYSFNREMLKTKAEGELALREIFPEAVIVRPSIMYGFNDKFLTYYVSQFRRMPYRSIYLYGAGEKTYKMPLWVSDAAMGLEYLIRDMTSQGETYEFVGPHRHKMSEMIDYLYHKARCYPEIGFGIRRHNIPDPFYLSYILLREQIDKWMRIQGMANRQWMDYVEATNDVLTGCKTLADLPLRPLAEFDKMAAKYVQDKTVFTQRIADQDEAYFVPPPVNIYPAQTVKRAPAPVKTESKIYQKPFELRV